MSDEDEEMSQDIARPLPGRPSGFFAPLSRRFSSDVLLLSCMIFLVGSVVIATHWPALSAKALLFDDDEYMTENPLVQSPGWGSARRFLGEVMEPSTVAGYYQSLAMISIMLDYAMGGRADNLMPFHRTSLALHAANTALIIILLYLLFGRVWIAAGVGLLFGLHPMTVEPIPWVGERKTLLAAFFAFLCLICYVRFARKRTGLKYGGCLLLYVLALMSKPTSTPIPFLMLLMDYWPLKRFNRRAVLEKLPFLVVGGMSAIVTYVSQTRTAFTELPAEYGLSEAILSVCHNIVFYPYKILWPANLSSHYPFPQPMNLSNPVLVAVVVGSIVLIVMLVISLRRTPALLTGWLFFFVAILPTMGVVRFTNVIASDKFVYLPSMGLLMVLAYFLGRLSVPGSPLKKRLPLAAVILVLAGAEAFATRAYLVYWRDSIVLYERMLTLAPNAAPVYNNLGTVFQESARYDEAIACHRRAIEIDPKSATAYNNLGAALLMHNDAEQAIAHFDKALEIKPYYARAFNNRGFALQLEGRIPEAIENYGRALELRPHDAEANYNLGNVLESLGRRDEAVGHYRKAIKARPAYTKAHNNLAVALASAGKKDEAMHHFREAVKTKPNDADLHYNIGVLLYEQQRLEEAAAEFRTALKIDPNHTRARQLLSVVLENVG